MRRTIAVGLALGLTGCAGVSHLIGQIATHPREVAAVTAGLVVANQGLQLVNQADDAARRVENRLGAGKGKGDGSGTGQ